MNQSNFACFLDSKCLTKITNRAAQHPATTPPQLIAIANL